MIKHLSLIVTFTVALFSFSADAAAEETEWHEIGWTQTKATRTVYIRNATFTPWLPLSNGCQAKEVFLSAMDPGGFGDMMAQVLFAKGTGREVRFSGSCNSSKTLFVANAIEVN